MVIGAFHAEWRDVAEQLHPFAAVVLDAAVADAVVRVAAADAVVVIVHVDGFECVDVRGERVVAKHALGLGRHNQVAVEGRDIDVVVIRGDFKSV